MQTLTQAQEDALEALIDSTSLNGVVQALSRIAFNKAEHLQSNWQDQGTARCWENAGRELDRCSTHFTVI